MLEVTALTKGLEDLLKLEKEWELLHELSPYSGPFNSWDWCKAWWEVFKEKNDQLYLLLFKEKNKEEIVGIAPLYIAQKTFKRFLKVRSLSFLASDHVGSDYLNIIIKPGFEESVLETFFSYIKDSKNKNIWDILELSDIEVGSPLYNSYQEHALKNGLKFIKSDRLICPKLELPADFKSYEMGLSSNRRKKLRRKTKQFGEKFDLSFHMAKTPEEVEEVGPALFELNRLRFASINRDGGFKDNSFSAFHTKVMKSLSYKNKVVIGVLKADGKIVSTQYILPEKKRWYSYQAGNHPDWIKYEPGMVLDGKLIASLIEDNDVQVFDFLRGAEPYKYSLGAIDGHTEKITLFNNHIKGKCALLLTKLQGLKKLITHKKFC
jgi:CelD/BcsL family acetyltransferase involved in cellulose biosynthesis